MRTHLRAVGVLTFFSFLLLPSLTLTLAAEIAARVLSVTGEAFAEKTPLKVGLKLGPGVTVSTKADGKVKLFLYPRAIVYLGPNSRMRLGKAEQPSKIFAGVFRFIYSKAEEFKKGLLAKGTFTATESENAVVGIRGTDYMVSFNPVFEETEIISFEGTLEFTNKADEADTKEVPPEHWGGLGGRFGEKTHDLIHLSGAQLDYVRTSLTWDTQIEGAKEAEDLSGEAIPPEGPVGSFGP